MSKLRYSSKMHALIAPALLIGGALAVFAGALLWASTRHAVGGELIAAVVLGTVYVVAGLAIAALAVWVALDAFRQLREDRDDE